MKNQKNNVVLFEDHTQSYYEWKKRRFKNLPLVHLDAHLDFAFFYAKKPKQALGEARSLAELKRELDKTFLMRKFKRNIEKQENIGNYIYPAIREGIVNDFYWILPGKITENTKKIIQRVFEKDPFKSDLIFNKKNKTLGGKIYNRNFHAAVLKDFSLKKPLLLDIDLDYLMYELGKEKPAKKNRRLQKKDIERKPWIYPKEFVQIIKDKFPRPVFITIAYSVNGGYTPILYKFFGDEILLRLEGVTDKNKALDKLLDKKNNAIKKEKPKVLFKLIKPIEKVKINIKVKRKFLAHIYFWLFYLLNQKKYYRKAVEFDNTYRVKDNNYGWQYLRAKRFKKAESEFMRVLKADRKNKYACLGLAQAFINKDEYKNALRYLQKIEKSDKEVYLNLANCYFQLKQYKRAGLFLNKIKGYSGLAEYLRARLALIKKQSRKKVIEHLKNSVMLGMDMRKVWQAAKKILDKKDPNYQFFQAKYNQYLKLKRKKN